MACASNLRQMAIGVSAYSYDNNGVIPRSNTSTVGHEPAPHVTRVTSSSQFTITAGPPSKTSKSGMPKYQINQDGSETSGAGFYSSGQ